jgi:predicted dehydrogenase
MAYERLQQFGRKIRWGMVGGGFDSLIGECHRMAARVDNAFDLVAGCMSIDPEIAVSSAAKCLVAPARTYTDFRKMAEAESRRPDGVEVVTIATPPNSHMAIAEAFMSHGISVICEKPMTSTVEDALRLQALTDEFGGLFMVTHCYTGYPMVREARALVQAGAIGRVRQIECDFVNGSFLTEEEDRKKRHWRFRPEYMGEEAILGELGAHCYDLAAFVSGRYPVQVSANMTTLTPLRETADDAHVTLRYADGSLGRMWLTFTAAGLDHGLSFRIAGEAGTLSWSQVKPDELKLSRAGTYPELRSPGHPDLMTTAGAYACRLREGHPEGYILAFANLYRDFAETFMANALGEAPHHLAQYPHLESGLETMRFYEAAAASRQHDGNWVAIGTET